MSSSADSSPLSTPPPVDSEDERIFLRNSSARQSSSPKEHSPSEIGTEKQEQKHEKSPPGKRKAFPPREPLLEDDWRFAFCVSFQARFQELFKSLPNLGPQDFETGLATTPISDSVEQLLCRLLSLILNRKKYVERGHYGRALEEAVSQHHQKEGSSTWKGSNPLQGGKTFNQLAPGERLEMLRYLILWALGHSEAVQAILKDNYKLSRREDDLNVPLSIQPWGLDRDKNKYYLIEGLDDTYFRVYQEHISPGAKNSTWRSVAGSIDDLHMLATIMADDGSQRAKEFQARIVAAIPRFEEGENKRKRREYRSQRKAYFAGLATGPSLYEGRTRGKRIRYTFDSEDDGDNDSEGGFESASGVRSSSRLAAATAGATPVDSGPYTTHSGRRIRKPQAYADPSMSSTNGTTTPYAASDSGGSTSRPTRTSALRNQIMDLDLDDDDDDGRGEASSEAPDDDGEDYRYEEPLEDDDLDDMDDINDAKDDELVIDRSKAGSLNIVLKLSPAILKRALGLEVREDQVKMMDMDHQDQEMTDAPPERKEENTAAAAAIDIAKAELMSEDRAPTTTLFVLLNDNNETRN